MYKNCCRVCLIDGAEYSIFENIDNKESIYSKLFLCVSEKIQDIEGHPRKICESCKHILNIVYDFKTKYENSTKLLESGLLVVKKEQNETKIETEILEDDYLMICKSELDTDNVQMKFLDDFWLNVSEPNKVKKEPITTNVRHLKAKLKQLKEISFRKKPQKRRKTGGNGRKVATSPLKASINQNGKSLKSNKIKLVKKIQVIQEKSAKAPSTPASRLCDICGEIIGGSKSMQEHVNAKHLSKPEKCPNCPKLFKGKNNLMRHIKNIHGEKLYICDYCGITHAMKHLLSVHIRNVHLGLRKRKRYPCNICGKDFLAPKYVTIHQRSAHLDLRPAECSVCGSCFFHEDYLKQHMRLHTGETPFKCPICDRGYAQRGNMVSHMSHNHRLADLSEEQIKTLKPKWFKYLKP